MRGERGAREGGGAEREQGERRRGRAGAEGQARDDVLSGRGFDSFGCVLSAGGRRGRRTLTSAGVAIGETVILLHLPLPLVGVSVAMERERQQNDSLADG